MSAMLTRDMRFHCTLQTLRRAHRDHRAQGLGQQGRVHAQHSARAELQRGNGLVLRKGMQEWSKAAGRQFVYGLPQPTAEL